MEVLSHDFHFWLQRGSLEVEEGNLNLAENYLGQGRGVAPDDNRLLTEFGYLRMKQAATDPTALQAQDKLTEGMTILENQILISGKTDSYPYHVLGSQGLAWSRRANLTNKVRNAFLDKLRDRIKSGLAYHGRNTDLRQLAADIETDYLKTAIK